MNLLAVRRGADDVLVVRVGVEVSVLDGDRDIALALQRRGRGVVARRRTCDFSLALAAKSSPSRFAIFSFVVAILAVSIFWDVKTQNNLSKTLKI